jgi:hypothetical protein
VNIADDTKLAALIFLLKETQNILPDIQVAKHNVTRQVSKRAALVIGHWCVWLGKSLVAYSASSS